MVKLFLYCFVAGALLTLCALFLALITVPTFGKHVTPGVMDATSLILLGGFFTVSASVIAIAEWRGWRRMGANRQTVQIKILMAVGAGLVVAILGTATIHIFRYSRESFGVLSATLLTALVLYLLITLCLFISFMGVRFINVLRHRT